MSRFFMTFISLVLASSTVFAAKGAVYCKVKGAVVNAVAEDSPCAGALYQGNACFTGDRGAVIELINNGEIVLSDEEWISDAHFQGRGEISYQVTDGPNEENWKETLVRCDSGFFRK